MLPSSLTVVDAFSEASTSLGSSSLRQRFVSWEGALSSMIFASSAARDRPS
jgi:hypothetical protein